MQLSLSSVIYMRSSRWASPNYVLRTPMAPKAGAGCHDAANACEAQQRSVLF